LAGRVWAWAVAAASNRAEVNNSFLCIAPS
jgi:hypothetical protein